MTDKELHANFMAAYIIGVFAINSNSHGSVCEESVIEHSVIFADAALIEWKKRWEKYDGGGECYGGNSRVGKCGGNGADVDSTKSWLR